MAHGFALGRANVSREPRNTFVNNVRQPCQPGPSSSSKKQNWSAERYSCQRHNANGKRKEFLSVSSVRCEAPGLASTTSQEGPPTYVTAPGRIVAIGDIHGDLQKTLTSLALCGVFREGPNREPLWCGGNTTLVQLGDVLDRGDREIGVIMLLRELDRQARQEGGAVFMLNGNHEGLNVAGQYRYVTDGGLRETAIAAGLTGAELNKKHFLTQARTKMFAPGQPMALELAKNPTVLIINNTLFAHGGVLPCHVTYGLERINAEVAAWMRGDILPNGNHAPPPFQAIAGKDSVMWNRQFGQQLMSTFERYCACSQLRSTLSMLGVKHLVVGHTPQKLALQAKGANCECNGQVWRLDVGMSGGVLDAVPQVLEIVEEKTGMTHVRLLTAQSRAPFFDSAANHVLNSLTPFRPRQQVMH